ncbi:MULTISPECIES: OsmC family protein [unclassified Streptomyces]|uniref:OsmC family protein n=1 Tax=Streptomyces sp. AM 3-1-1 TaxID=3028711 RepID=UPI0023B909AB|nr:OsmC family protein [Streptomyces sp. AM 3-1-1]WEH27451.1 OsmC family protein [Streptomyces sp. AM 3-1-1]
MTTRPAPHAYLALLQWQGSTATGIRGYSRTHTALAPPAAQRLALSADPAFRGDPELLNPEQLLLTAASSCQLLSFLGEAARAGVEVLAYEDEASARLDPERGRLDAIRLAVTVRVAPGTDPEAVRELVARAHRACYVANSLAVPVEVVTEVEVSPRG